MPDKLDPPPLVKVLIVAMGSLVGAFFSSFCLAGGLAHPTTPSETAWNCAARVIGMVAGGLLFWWCSVETP